MPDLKPGYARPLFVNEGMIVYAPGQVPPGTDPSEIPHLRCTVLSAHGDMARVINREREYDRVLPLTMLVITSEERRGQERAEALARAAV